MVASVHLPQKVWIEYHDTDYDTPASCDVLVKMEDDNIFTAHFVTLVHLRRQMDLSYTVTSQIEFTPAVRYATLEHPHILVDDLSRDTIEDTIDNLIALDIFTSMFTQVTEDVADTPEAEARTTSKTATRATQELAAVVLSDVLVVEADD
ncbi:MAG: hypothetical protein AAF125_00155 [Chloroflexota bacterium]